MAMITLYARQKKRHMYPNVHHLSLKAGAKATPWNTV